MKKTLLIFSFLSLLVACDIGQNHNNNTRTSHHWGYGGAIGPSHWGAISPDFEVCGSGKAQSPINIEKEEAMNLQPLEFHYGDSNDSIVINNGHTIQVNYAKGSYAVIGGEKYELLQFHFHSPSEHLIHGKYADLVAHLVHKSEDGRLAVIAILFNRGIENEFLDPIWHKMPKYKSKITLVGRLRIAMLLPEDKTYFNYSGSLTTPPCTEGVNWNILTTYASVSLAQVSEFMHLFPKSIRPVQDVNNRVVGIGVGKSLVENNELVNSHETHAAEVIDAHKVHKPSKKVDSHTSH